MRSFRFLHAADIHLDSPLKGLLRYPGAGAERYRTATREAFDRLVEAAIDERVDFLVIAGDLYDGDWRDLSTGLHFASWMARLADAEIPVYLLHGNHDAESVITRRLELPANVHVFGAREPQTFVLDDLRVALHGQSFARPAELKNLVPGYAVPVSNAFNIGVLHTALEGMCGHARYAPGAIGDLTAMGYNYWVLGHVHQHQVLHERPHVVFPGNLQGRHIRETGPRGACLVTVRDHEVAAVELIPLDVVRWSRVQVPVEDARSLVHVNERMRAAIESAVVAEADGRLLVMRLALAGRTGLHARVAASNEALLAEARAAALTLGEGVAWVEKVEVVTRQESTTSSVASIPSLHQDSYRCNQRRGTPLPARGRSRRALPPGAARASRRRRRSVPHRCPAWELRGARGRTRPHSHCLPRCLAQGDARRGRDASR